MDDSIFYARADEATDESKCMFDDTINHGVHVIFYHVRDILERVSIRNAKYCVSSKFPLLMRMRDLSEPKAVPQEGLMKFVRHASNLRWFRSDLTPENVAILKAERPEITFVS
jgi:hypothetical protein